MASVFTCDFEGNGTGPSDGDNLTASNTTATEVQTSGTVTTKFDSGIAHEGTFSGEFIATAGYGNLRWGSLNETKIWVTGYIYYDGTAPDTNCVIAEMYDQASSLIGQLRITTAGLLQLRDVTTADWSSTALSTGWHRIGWLIDLGANNHRCRIYSGANLDTTTTSQDSTDLALTLNGTATSINSVKLGILTTSTFTVRWDDVRTDDTTEPTPSADNATFDLTATYTTDTGTLASWSLDATGSTGTVTLSQNSGTTASVTESPTGVFAITNPTGTDALSFDLSAGSDTITFTLTRGGGGRSFLVREGGVWA